MPLIGVVVNAGKMCRHMVQPVPLIGVVVYAGKMCRHMVQPMLPLVDFFSMWADNYNPAA